MTKKVSSDPIKIKIDEKDAGEISLVGELIGKCEKCGKVHKEMELCEKEDESLR